MKVIASLLYRNVKKTIFIKGFNNIRSNSWIIFLLHVCSWKYNSSFKTGAVEILFIKSSWMSSLGLNSIKGFLSASWRIMIYYFSELIFKISKWFFIEVLKWRVCFKVGWSFKLVFMIYSLYSVLNWLYFYQIDLTSR